MKLTAQQRKFVLTSAAFLFNSGPEDNGLIAGQERSVVQGDRITLKDENGNVLRIYRCGDRKREDEEFIPDDGVYV